MLDPIWATAYVTRNGRFARAKREWADPVAILAGALPGTDAARVLPQ